MTANHAEKKAFKSKALYKKLVLLLPIYVKNPFAGETATLDCPKVWEALNISHETFYKWLRTCRLTPENATALVDLANQEANIAALVRLDRQPPTREDFLPFVFGDA